jgi:hypothetical protein
LMNPMICSVLKRLFFMSVLVVDGLYSFTWYGSAGAGHIEFGFINTKAVAPLFGEPAKSTV